MTFTPSDDPFREERHYSRTAVAYSLVIVVLLGIGLAMYWFDFRNRPPLENESSRIRDEIRESLDES